MIQAINSRTKQGHLSPNPANLLSQECHPVQREGAAPSADNPSSSLYRSRRHVARGAERCFVAYVGLNRSRAPFRFQTASPVSRKAALGPALPLPRRGKFAWLIPAAGRPQPASGFHKTTNHRSRKQVEGWSVCQSAEGGQKGGQGRRWGERHPGYRSSLDTKQEFSEGIILD